MSLGISDCGAPKLKWDGTIYVGSSADSAVIGRKNGETIIVPANDQKFDVMTCTDTFYELQEAYKQLLDKCEKWRP